MRSMVEGGPARPTLSETDLWEMIRRRRGAAHYAIYALRVDPICDRYGESSMMTSGHHATEDSRR
jgi:hypothetical protein